VGWKTNENRGLGKSCGLFRVWWTIRLDLFREAWQQDGAKWTKLAANKEQRLGRLGRVKKGIFVLLLVEESKLPCASLFLSDAFCRVHAMSSYHEQIGLSDLSLCNVPDHLVDEAAIFVSELKLSDFDMRLALTAFGFGYSVVRRFGGTAVRRFGGSAVRRFGGRSAVRLFGCPAARLFLWRIKIEVACWPAM
jgi:hypothetical protein